MMSLRRFSFPVFRFPVLLLLFIIAVPARAQERISPLPPPVTRGLYRTHWFVFLNAYLEEDARAAAGALEQLKKAALAVGVRRLSDFSRTALYEARKAEASGRIESADRGYGAALELDDANLNACSCGRPLNSGLWVER